MIFLDKKAIITRILSKNKIIFNNKYTFYGSMVKIIFILMISLFNLLCGKIHLFLFKIYII